MLDCVFAGQALHSDLSAAAYVSAWQSAQVLDDVAAWAAEYLPAVHAVHVLEPTVPL